MWGWAHSPVRLKRSTARFSPPAPQSRISPPDNLSIINAGGRTQIIIQSIISRQSRCSKQVAAYVVTAALGCRADHSSARFSPKAQWETFCPE
jgi:hypothetical protein